MGRKEETRKYSFSNLTDSDIPGHMTRQEKDGGLAWRNQQHTGLLTHWNLEISGGGNIILSILWMDMVHFQLKSHMAANLVLFHSSSDDRQCPKTFTQGYSYSTLS